VPVSGNYTTYARHKPTDLRPGAQVGSKPRRIVARFQQVAGNLGAYVRRVSVYIVQLVHGVMHNTRKFGKASLSLTILLSRIRDNRMHRFSGLLFLSLFGKRSL